MLKSNSPLILPGSVYQTRSCHNTTVNVGIFHKIAAGTQNEKAISEISPDVSLSLLAARLFGKYTDLPVRQNRYFHMSPEVCEHDMRGALQCIACTTS